MCPDYRLFNQYRWGGVIGLCLWSTIAFSQPGVKWDLTFGGENYEELNGLQLAPDGIYAGGSSRSNILLGRPSDTSWNLVLLKTDLNGQPLWHRSYGGDRNDRLWSLLRTDDGRILLGGYSFSGISGEKTSPSKGGMDVWLLCVDAQGDVLWQQSYGGAGKDELFDILEMPDGGFLLGCHSTSDIGGEKSENSRGGQDFWLVRIDENGNVLWDKTIGGDREEQIHDLWLLPSGNVLASGGTASLRNTGEVGPDFARGQKDYWILEFNPNNRQVVWNHRFGGSGDDFAYALHRSDNGHLWLGGRSASPIAPPTSFNNGKDATFWGGESDFWLLELDAQGKKLREWSFGGSGLDDLYAIQPNYRGDLCLLGVSDSPVSGNKTAPSIGLYDYWLVVLDPNLGQSWQRTFAGADIDAPTQLQRCADGALILGGHSQSPISGVKSSASFGLNDFWILKTECEVAVTIVQENVPPPCSNEAVTLSALPENCTQCQFNWNTGESTPDIFLAPGDSGWYHVRVTDRWGCIAQDSIWAEAPAGPQIDLGPPDTLLAEGGSLILGSGQPDWNYQWNTGDTGSSLVIGQEGFYAVTITDAAGCTATDQIWVYYRKSAAVWAPNVFTPDFDGHDDYFILYADRGVTSIGRLEIFDRWGALLFSANNLLPGAEPNGWDGTYRGKRLESGVYAWWAEVVFVGGERKVFYGNITIIR